MLRRENDLRLCAETQAAFRAVSSDPAGWLGVVETLQRRVCAEFGLSVSAGLNVPRRSCCLGMMTCSSSHSTANITAAATATSAWATHLQTRNSIQ